MNDITETAFYRSCRQHGCMTVAATQRPKKLETENARVKRLLAERNLAVDTLKKLLAKPYW